MWYYSATHYIDSFLLTSRLMSDTAGVTGLLSRKSSLIAVQDETYQTCDKLTIGIMWYAVSLWWPRGVTDREKWVIRTQRSKFSSIPSNGIHGRRNTQSQLNLAPLGDIYDETQVELTVHPLCGEKSMGKRSRACFQISNVNLCHNKRFDGNKSDGERCMPVWECITNNIRWSSSERMDITPNKVAFSSWGYMRLKTGLHKDGEWEGAHGHLSAGP